MHPGDAKRGFIGRISLQAEIAKLMRHRDRVRRLLQDHERGAAGLQALRQHHADTAEAADDHMVAQSIDLLVHAFGSEELVELIEGDELHQAAGEVDHPGAAEHDGGDSDAA